MEKSRKVSNIMQLCSAKRYTVNSGNAKGQNIIEVSNGVLDFTLLEDKCLDILQLKHKGTNLSFITKNGLHNEKHPFPEVFAGGQLYTCGIDSIGERDGYETHGGIHNKSAEINSLSCNLQGIEINATVKNNALFGRNLTLKRKVFTAQNSNVLTIEDTLINEGFQTENYVLLYHMNFGYPFLDKDTKISADIIKTEGRTDWAKHNIAKCLEMEEPSDDVFEQVFFHKVKSGNVDIINKKLGRKANIKYNENILPCLIEWKSMQSGDYALGIEPSTCFLDDKFQYKTIKSGQ